MNVTIQPSLPGGTQVLNTTDGEPGSILGGSTVENGEWTEYEVETRYGVERWKRSDFIRFDEIETA